MVGDLKEVPLKFLEKEGISDTHSGEWQIIDPKIRAWLKGIITAMMKGIEKEKKKGPNDSNISLTF